MLQVTPQHKILVATDAVDFRKGIDSLVALCRHRLEQDPFSGGLFVFTNRRRSAIKIIVYDGQGFWLCMKRFSKGKLKWWPTGDHISQVLSASELLVLLYNGNPQDAKLAPDWRKLPAT